MSTVQNTAHRGCHSAEPKQFRATLEAKLQNLIPIAMVIVGGCESCAEKMVARALQQGSSPDDIDKTLCIIAHMHKLDCFAAGVGLDVVARMDRPLAAARKTLLAMPHNC
jgi:alkylhydroperoxidase/carboxymuconolactone decarboxylase family protein YurZ